jgi:hypothetical protein
MDHMDDTTLRICDLLIVLCTVNVSNTRVLCSALSIITITLLYASELLYKNRTLRRGHAPTRSGCRQV